MSCAVRQGPMAVRPHRASAAALGCALLGMLAGCGARTQAPWVEDGVRQGTIEYRLMAGDGVEWRYYDKGRQLRRVEERATAQDDAALRSATVYSYEGERVVAREFRGPSGALE